MQLKLEPEFLKMYQHLIKWAKGGKVSVLDVGCGTGCTTIKVLKPFLPENFQELVGLDSCSEMIEFSKRNYKEDKMEFLVQDITKDLLLELRGRFHHIFSFFCLQVVPEQKKAFENFYTLLQPGGSMLLMFLNRQPIYDVYEKMAEENKWSKYMKNVERHISPYLHSEDPVKESREIASEAGFKVTFCEISKETWIYPNFESFKSFLCSVNTFMNTMPEELKDEFLKEVMENIMTHEYVHVMETGTIRFNFTMIFIAGEKVH